MKTMLIKLKYSVFRALAFNRAFSGKALSVKISEQKVKVGNYEINYVKSFLEGENPQKTLICLPGALGEHLIRRIPIKL